MQGARRNGADDTRRSLLAKAGLIAGGVAAAVLHGSERAHAQTIGETMDIAPPAGDAALKLRPSGAVGRQHIGRGSAEPRQLRVARRGRGALFEPGCGRARSPAGREPGEPGESPTRGSHPELRHVALGLDPPRPGRRRGRLERRGAGHRVHEPARHDAWCAWAGGRPRDGQDHARETCARGYQRVRDLDRAARRREPRARESSSATTRATRPPASS